MSDQGNKTSAMRYVGLGTQWMALLLVAVWGGYKLDEMTGWKFPVFIVTLPLVALCVSLWQLIKEVSKTKK
jgi:F0F1-type ATP synthase assembly protein I